ncbi:ion channel [Aeromicrobium sp.]|uniref:ion channel n=1 Tax=Aeromicrobium sp. TaxID=1871063 RepID=UPI003D6B537F
MSTMFGSGWRPVWSGVGLLVAYYAFPVGWGDSPTTGALLSLALTAAGLGLLGYTMVKELDHLRHGEEIRSTRALSILLVMLVMSFSFAFFFLDLVEPDQIANLSTRTDALYFTVSTMATVGYGDIHAEGQLARGLVAGLIVFNLVVVASLVRARRIGGHSSL